VPDKPDIAINCQFGLVHAVAYYQLQRGWIEHHGQYPISTTALFALLFQPNILHNFHLMPKQYLLLKYKHVCLVYCETCLSELRTECLRDLNCVFNSLCHAKSLHRDVAIFHHFLAVKLVQIQPSYLRNNTRTRNTQLHTQTHLI